MQECDAHAASQESLPDRTIALTVDDAFLSLHDRAWPLLKKFGLPFTLFDHENLAELKARFPQFSVLRKERALTDEQWNRIRFDKLTQGLEMNGRENPKAYEKRRDALVSSIAEDDNERRFKTNRVGVDGCCGKGCNGCLIFWQDDQYARAREVLLKRKQGEQLTRAEANELKLVAPQL